MTSRRRHPWPWQRRIGATAMLGLATAVLLPAPVAAARTGPVADVHSAADPERQAALVAAEDRRLNQVRAVTAVAPLKELKDRRSTAPLKWARPYRLDTAGGYTLVLTRQTEPYTVDDLLRLAPQTFLRQHDGGYLLTENIYLSLGASLTLSHPGGLTLRLASKNDGFVSIVSYGGGLTVIGTRQAPTTITSWDPRTSRPDTNVNDGRAYLRVIGGQFSMAHARLTNLGFWSGRTGGLSLTGTDRPNTGAIEGPLNLPGTASRPGVGEVHTLPSGPLSSPDSRFTVPGLSYVSARITHCTIVGNAFGLFISGANGITISDTRVQDSLQDGVVLHRFATSAVIERTTSLGNHGDGFILSRATQQVRVSGSTAERNGGNGFTLSGQPLADGPSASGESTASYGSNSVANSVARDNGHYGIEILGGITVSAQDNQVVGSDMGIVVRQAARTVTITGNRLTGQRRQGISVRDGVTGATVSGNQIERTGIGVYVRDSAAKVRGNTVSAADNHGVTFVGHVAGSAVSQNVLSGIGPSAVDTTRATGRIAVGANQTTDWLDTTAFWREVRHYASPMTLLWASILALIVILAGKRRGRASRRHRHPYADKMPLSDGAVREVAHGRARVPAMSE